MDKLLLEMQPVGVEEYGYVAPDPLDANIIYGGKITRLDKRTGQVQNIAPEAVRSGKYRFLRTAPVLFSPVDKKTLFFAGNVLFKTLNGGQSWQTISPDLSRDSWDIPASVGIYASNDLKTMPRRGVIYTVAPSHQDINTIWAGTDDGLIHRTTDGGKTWKNITPPAITSWSKISLIDASHFDNNTAYVAVNRIRLDDMKPHVYVTHNGGLTWKEITSGLQDPINVVREDPTKKGMLYAGSERQVYVSDNDGETWISLRLNMPATSIRDLVIKDDDIVVGTHGRSFWILDNISSLRQMNGLKTSGTMLFKPQAAVRVRWNTYTDTPIPQEEPAGQNPPDGAMIEYTLANESTGSVNIEIADKSGQTVARFRSNDTMVNVGKPNIPLYWIRPTAKPGTQEGTHRFVWDLHYQPLNITPTYPIGAVYQNTAPNYTSPWVMPGMYTIKLTAGNKTYTQPLQVKMDPRVKLTPAALQQQHDLSVSLYKAKQQTMEMLNAAGKYNSKLIAQKQNASGDMNAVTSQLQQLSTFTSAGNTDVSIRSLDAALATLLDVLQDADAKPTTQAVQAVAEVLSNFGKLQVKWKEFVGEMGKK